MQNIYNARQVNPEVTQIPTSKSPLWKWSVGSATVLLAVLLLIYSGGMDAIFRLLGVGASGIYEVQLTSTNDFLGVADHNMFIGNSEMKSANVFARFSSLPQDIDLNKKGLGFITSTFSPDEISKGTYPDKSEYISPVIDLGYPNPYINAIEMVDYNPTPEQTTQYYYRVADSAPNMLDVYFMPLDTTLVKSKDNIKIKSAPINQIGKRYIQLKTELNDNTPERRSAIYSMSVQYKETNDTVSISDFSQIVGPISERRVEVQYSSVNAPLAASVEVLSGELDAALVYSASGVNLQERINYSFDVALSPGAYALVVSGSTIENRIVPFPVTGDMEVIRVNAGSFESTTGILTGDLNGDGVINAADMLIEMNK